MTNTWTHETEYFLWVGGECVGSVNGSDKTWFAQHYSPNDYVSLGKLCRSEMFKTARAAKAWVEARVSDTERE